MACGEWREISGQWPLSLASSQEKQRRERRRDNSRILGPWAVGHCHEHAKRCVVVGLERNRFAVGKTAISLVSPRPQQLAPSGRARLLREPRRSAVLSSGLTTQGGGLEPFLAV